MHFIAVSRQMGACGTEIAKRVAAALGYALYDTDAIQEMAQELGFLSDVRKIDEKAPSLLKRFWSDRPTIEMGRLSSAVYELARKGDAVILGRGSAILLKTFNCALRVRIAAPREKRIQNLVSRGYAEEAAARAVDRSDQERSAFIKFAFGADWDSSQLYDLVLNTEKMSVDLSVNIILQVARSHEIEACSVDALRSIEMMALARRTEAAIVEAGLPAGPLVSILVSVPEPGKVVLTGIVQDQATRAKAEEIVRGIKGVASVEDKTRVIKAD
jgi:cytidylate kinase